MKINWDKILFWLLISVVVTLPLQVTELLFPVHLLGSSFPVLEFSRLLAAVGISALLIKFLVTRKIFIPKDSLSLVLYVFIAVNGLSLVTFRSHPGLLEVLRYSFHLSFFLLIVNSVRDTGALGKIAGAFLLTGLAIALFSIFQYYSGFYLWNGDLSGWIGSIGQVVNRVNATFLDPNTLARFMGIVITFSTAYYAFAATKWGKFLALFSANASVAALFFTLSRAGWASFGISFLALILVIPKNLKIMLFYTFLLLTSALVYLTSPGVMARVGNVQYVIEETATGTAGQYEILLGSRLQNSATGSGSDTGEMRFKEVPDYLGRILTLLPLDARRLAAIKAGILMFLNNPLFGVGIGNFQKSYTTQYSYMIAEPPPNENPVTLSHSSLITLIAELGLVGILWFSVFLFTLTRVFIRALAKDPHVKFVSLACGISLLLLILHSQYQGNLFEDPLFWLLNGILVSGQRISSKEQSQR